MKIVHVAAEFAPLAKVGGLGEALSGLTNELSKREDVEVVIPRYNTIDLTNFEKGAPLESSVPWHRKLNDIKVTLIEPNLKNFFKRKNIYGYKDDPKRFIYFSKNALEYLLKNKIDIDILHIHDWHVATCAILQKDTFQKRGLKIKKICLNIHNLSYQGICKKKLIKDLDKSILKNITSGIFIKRVNLLKGGIILSDHVIAVSPTYAKEIKTKKYGCGLDKPLREKKDNLLGILNGIDYRTWNPKKDRFIPYNYDKTLNIEDIIKIKEKNKIALQKELGLDISKRPLFVNIGRLVPQKGPALIKEAIFHTDKKNCQFVLLGSSNIKKLQKKFLKIKKRFKEDKNISIQIGFDEALAHKIYAAADFIIVPSRFEPCGLTQMIALRYGTIPIVRKTGGLKDTITEKNGFVFEKFKKRELTKKMDEAISAFKDNKKMESLIREAIEEDNSFSKASKEYLSLYKKILID